MKKLSLLLPFSILLFTSSAADWHFYSWLPKSALHYALESKSPESFAFSLTRTNSSLKATGGMAIRTINRECWTQSKFVFSIRSLNEKTVEVEPSANIAFDGKTRFFRMKTIRIAGRSWRDVVVSLDSDLGLGDRSVKIVNVGFCGSVESWKTGETGGFEVRNARFCAPSEVTFAGADQDEIVSVPASSPVGAFRRNAQVPPVGAFRRNAQVPPVGAFRRNAQVPPVGAFRRNAPPALRVYFHFDNEDLRESDLASLGHIRDKQQTQGFRGELLKATDGAAVVTDDIDAADVFVAASVRPDPKAAARIARRVREEGVPLIAAGEIADPALAALLPCDVAVAGEDLPKRLPLAFADESHPLAKGGGLSSAPFGQYFALTPRTGSRTVVRFADGASAAVEGTAGRGRVLYAEFMFGQSVIPNRAATDAFFLRALGWMTGRTFPERVAVSPRPDVTGWWTGVGTNAFGRFGWEIGSDLLCEKITARLSVVKGIGEYRFDEPNRNFSARRKIEFAADRANTLAYGGAVRVDGALRGRFDASLGYPGVRWEIAREAIELRLYNLMEFIAWPTAGGVRVARAAMARIDPCELSEPWLLLFNGGERDSPLLLVLGKRPDGLRVLNDGEDAAGLSFARKGGVGVIVPTWISGAAPEATAGWETALPDEIVSRIRFWYPRAFAYPVAVDERFQIDAANERVEIRDRFVYLMTADDWRTPTRKYAPIPPIAAISPVGAFRRNAQVSPVGAFRRNAQVSPVGAFRRNAQIGDDLPTAFGPFAARDGADEVRWSLPLPRLDPIPPLEHVRGFPQYDALANELCASSVLMCCGCPIECHGHVYPMGIGNAGQFNRSMHESLMGLNEAFSNPGVYTPENMRRLRHRARIRFLDLLESQTYKFETRFRREPASGIEYTIYFASPRRISTRFEPATYGSKTVYGDSNETVMMILDLVRKLEEEQGQEGLAAANWETLRRRVASYPFALDDWGYLASGCLERGGPGSIDMLNCEYAGMCALARLARIVGDEATRAQALYRAARRMCPTLARYRMRDYYAAHGMLADAAYSISRGFEESGAVFRRRGAGVSELEFLDMSQTIPKDLIALHDRFGWEDLRRDYLPDLRAATTREKGLKFPNAAILALIGGETVPREELRAYVDACVEGARTNPSLVRTWQGMRVGSYLEYVLQRLSQDLAHAAAEWGACE